MESDTLINIIEDIKVFIYGGIQTLPLTLGGTLLILGLFTANYAILFFLIGYLIATPIVAWGFNSLISAIINKMESKPKIFHIFSADVCKVYKPSESAKQEGEVSVVSEWMAMISFFTGYMINNALYLYNRDNTDVINTISSDPNVQPNLDTKILNRKSHAAMSIITSIIILGIVLYFRHATQCETSMSSNFGITILRIFLAIGIYGTAGYFWYVLLSSVMDNRLSDLFGIANRLLPPVALDKRPVACVPYSN